MSKTKKTIFWIVGIVFIAAAATGIYFFNKKVPGLKHATPAYSITADELYNDFQEDESAAMSKYKDKVLSVTGEVLSIKSSEEGSNVMLHAENAMANGINCSFKGPVPQISEGDEVTIKGRCQGLLMDVILNNCYAE